MAEAELSQIGLKTTLLGWRWFTHHKVLLLGGAKSICLRTWRALAHLSAGCSSGEYWQRRVLTRLARLHYLSLRNGVLRALTLFTWGGYVWAGHSCLEVLKNAAALLSSLWIVSPGIDYLWTEQCLHTLFGNSEMETWRQLYTRSTAFRRSAFRQGSW